jgi:GGDEF domain-containing protein
MGGDEFAAYLVEADEEAGRRLIARLRKQPGSFAFSAGAAHYPSDALDGDALFRLADERLYTAKRANAA